jgi:ABC-type transport system involved in multi-copper enzyme maturation permease subunit
MNDIKKIFRFELAKIKRNKLMTAILSVLLAAVLALPAVYFFVMGPTQPPVEVDRAEALREYRADLAQYEDFLAQHGPNMTKKQKRLYEDICKRIRFYVETGTIESDYLNSDTLTSPSPGKEYSAFMFFFATASAFFLWALAIAAAAYLFLFEYHTHTLKNIFASGIGRNKLFGAKLLLLLAFLTAVFLILTLFGLAFGLVQQNALLVLFYGNYVAMNAPAVFITQAAATYVIMLTLLAAAVFAGILFQNIAVGIASPGAVYGAAFLIYFGISDLIATNPAYSHLNYLDKIPVLSLQVHVGGFDPGFIITLALHSLLAGLLLFFARCKLKRQDI